MQLAPPKDIHGILETRYSTISRIGSFWTSCVPRGGPQDLVRWLSRLPELQSTLDDLELGLQKLSGSNDNMYAYREVPFDPDKVSRIGGDLNARVRVTGTDSEGQLFTIIRRPADYSEAMRKWARGMAENPDFTVSPLVSEAGDFLLFPVNEVPNVNFQLGFRLRELENRYLLPIPEDCWPEMLLVQDGSYWVHGIDYVLSPGVLITSHNPYTAFRGDSLHMVSTRRTSPSWMAYAVSSENPSGDSREIVGYVRRQQNPKTFEAAIAQAAGLTVTQRPGTFLEATPRPGGRMLLRFDTWTALVDHPLFSLPAVGEFVPENTVIGGLVKVHTKPTASASWAWYRTLDWRNGMSLDPVSPVKGITVPEGMVLAEAYDETEGNLHVRLHLEAATETGLAAYWGLAKAGEILTGKYLNTVIGLSAVGESTLVNAMDLFWEHVLDARTIVVDLRTKDAGAYWHTRATCFIDREKPAGSMVLTRDLPVVPEV
jgi:hypothetical protein